MLWERAGHVAPDVFVPGVLSEHKCFRLHLSTLHALFQWIVLVFRDM
jgi:hypothetical protein